MEMGVERAGRRRLVAALIVATLGVVALAFAAVSTATVDGAYEVENLVSDQAGVAEHQDPNLVNAWGLTRTPTSPWWVANNGTDTSTIYRGEGEALSLVVSVPGGPTGAVANTGSGFVVANGSASGPARFIFVNEDGEIRGWNPTVAPTTAVLAKAVPGAIYKGVTLAGGMLYAANFHANSVDVFDSSFNLVTPPGSFMDPNLPADFAPFNIQNINGSLFVAYAKQDAKGEDEVAGLAQGFVDRYTTGGELIGRAAIRGLLNAPWGLALAPSNFGGASNDLLVGQFGNGRIIAYHLFGSCDPKFLPGPFHTAPQAPCSRTDGWLRGEDGRPLVIDGLWGLQFGGGNENSGDTDELYFTAGPDDETHGLFGEILKAE
jgi:uncharacterized protein (TIGR03118 family)